MTLLSCGEGGKEGKREEAKKKYISSIQMGIYSLDKSFNMHFLVYSAIPCLTASKS